MTENEPEFAMNSMCKVLIVQSIKAVLCPVAYHYNRIQQAVKCDFFFAIYIRNKRKRYLKIKIDNNSDCDTMKL